MYHRVLPWEKCVAYPLPALVVPVEAFRKQLQWLANHCRVLPLRDALSALSESVSPGKPLVSVTFDDGYSDNFDIVAPALEDFGLRGTFFVTSGFVARGNPQWYDRAAVAWLHISPEQRGSLAHDSGINDENTTFGAENVAGLGSWMEGLKRAAPARRLELLAAAESVSEREHDFSDYLPMSPEQVHDLNSRGHEIGSHTVSHPILPQLSDDSITAELRESAEHLRAWTGSPVTGFCYPNGNYDRRVEQAVVSAGYGYACTVEEGMNFRGDNLTRLARVPITMQRTMTGAKHDELGFRSEVSGARSAWRALRHSGGGQ